MTQILISFGCGLAFAMGVTVGFFALDMMTTKGRKAMQRQAHEHYARVEERLAVQVSAMLACLEELKRRP